ncbi:MAG: S41 family peptidase [Lachnospiraceae bacterium]|nr:S41 family peptidase [Lachnospiraceae bacterium]
MLMLLLLAGVVFVIVLRSTPQAATIDTEFLSDNAEQKLAYIRNKIQSDYLFDYSSVDYETEMIRAYVDSLGDPYSVYYTPDEYQELMESNSGTYYGIGVSVSQDPETGVITVIQVFRDSPAYEVGVQPEDQIYAVNGEVVGTTDINLIVTKIRGESGSKVKIQFYRPSINDFVEFDIERREVQVESASGKMLEGNIGYIQISSFDEVTLQQFARAYNELYAQGAKAVIFDLRNNGGGLLSSVVDIVDQLVPSGLITYIEDKNGNRSEYRSDANDVLHMPAVVLVNGYTASASEIFTAALQDHGKATIIGTKTFGKGIVQTIYSMSDGSGLKLTIARYYTPKGVCIHGVGIAPDIEVEEDYTTEEDEQLAEAIRVLLEKLR